MKYSLRSLMIGVTLFCLVVGGRIEYLRKWAVFQERAAASDRAWNSPLLGDAKGLRLYHDAKGLGVPCRHVATLESC
jgi:hypothetical protein